jgi:hypothetical protein
MMGTEKRKYESKYEDGQKAWLKTHVAIPGRKYISVKEVGVITKSFNETFSDSRTESAIVAQLRMIKTKFDLPVKIAYTGIQGVPRKQRTDISNVIQGEPEIRMISTVNGRITALLKELESAFKEVTRQNMEMKGELRKLAGVRSAIDKYRDGK